MSVDEVFKEQDYACCAHSVDVLVGVHVVKCHAIVDVQCVLVIRCRHWCFTLLCFRSYLLLSTSFQFSLL